MNNNLIVFKEQNYYFGIFPEDFERHFSMDHIVVNPSSISTSIWKFEAPQKSLKGYFVHLGALFGFSPVHIQHTGHLFVKESLDVRFAIFLDNFQMKIPVLEKGRNQIGIDKFHDLPAEIPKQAFRYVLVYRKKKILIVDPLMLFRSYDHLFPANV